MSTFWKRTSCALHKQPTDGISLQELAACTCWHYHNLQVLRLMPDTLK